MTPITRLTKKQARKLLTKNGKKIMSESDFDMYADLLGFKVYPGLDGPNYSEADLSGKWNMEQSQFNRELLKSK